MSDTPPLKSISISYFYSIRQKKELPSHWKDNS